MRIGRYGYLFLLSTVFFECKPANAVKSLKLGISKDQPIVVEVPPDQWVAKDISWKESTPISVLRVDPNYLSSHKWEDGTLPMLVEFRLQKAQDCGSGIMSGRIEGCPAKWRQVELRSENAWLKVQFPPEVLDIGSALRAIAFIGSVAQFEATNYLHDHVFLPNDGRLFGSLPGLSETARYALFKAGVIEGFDISSESFKGHGYALATIAVPITFNTVQVSQDQRVARVVRNQVLPAAKSLLRPTEGQPVGGLAFHLTIHAYNFVTGEEAQTDDLHVYMNMSDLRQFAQDNITSQQLMDGSIILLNGDRIDVHL